MIEDGFQSRPQANEVPPAENIPLKGGTKPIVNAWVVPFIDRTGLILADFPY